MTSFVSTAMNIARDLPPGAKSDSVLSGVDPTLVSMTNPLRLFIIQAAIIIILTRLLGVVLTRLRQPRVIAEVIGGIILGPTVMGHIPHFSQHIFPPTSLPFLNLVATIGLVLFLFIVGLEVDLRVIKRCAKESTAISVAGMVLPFGLGAAVSVGIYNDFIDHSKVNLGIFILFTGVAMAITAFPVLARILTENKLLQTKVGVIVLAAGVGNDVVGWILLALTVALVNASTGVTAVYVLLCAVGWTLMLFFVIKPAFLWLARRNGGFENGPNQLMMTVIILLVLVSAWVTDIIGVHPIFGSFLVGLMIPHEGGYAVAITEKVEDIVSVLFLPLYFALSGLKTNLGSLNSGLVWGYTVAIIAIAFFSKFTGCAAAAWYCGFNARESSAIGTLMSCKGLVELIVLNIGYSAGILDTRVFSMFVVMAVVSTVATTPLTLLAYPESIRTYLTAADFGGSAAKKTAKIDEKDGDEDDSSAISSKRLLVVLDRFEHVPGLMALVQLFQPSEASLEASTAEGLRRRTRHSVVDSTESDTDTSVKGGDADENSVPVLRSDAPVGGRSTELTRSSAPLTIDALRLLELTERTSAVMKVSESEDTMRADPILNVFRTFAHLSRVPVRSSMAVVSLDDFASTVVGRARNSSSNLVIVPWTINGTVLGSNDDQTQQSAVVAALSNPFDSIFGRGNSSSNADDSDKGRSSRGHAGFIRRVFQTASCDVGLLLERSNSGSSLVGAASFSRLAGAKTIMLAFFGGPDDRAALNLLVRLARANRALKLTVLHIRRVASEEASTQPSAPPTVHQTHQSATRNGDTIQSQYGTGGAVDTMYPTHNRGGGLEATLEDDLALKNASDALGSEESNYVLREISTARPLGELLRAVETDRPALVVVGRGRRMPVLTHREELRSLLIAPTDSAEAGSSVQDTSAANKLLQSEPCKVLGECAVALARARLDVPVLVFASSMRPQQGNAANA